MLRILGTGVALVWCVGLGFATAVVAANPWFLDSPGWFALLLYGVGGGLGVAVGLLLAPFRGTRPLRAAAARAPLALGLLAAGGVVLCIWSATRDPAVRDDRTKVVVVGLDGATYDILDPLIEAGRLPNLERLIRDGAAGELISIEPTISPALWTTMATGKLRGKHGVVNFRSLQNNLKAKRFWDIAHEAGLGIGMMDWLVSWPPLAEDGGFWIPSHMARGPETLPSKVGFLQQLLGATRDSDDATLTDRITWGFDALFSGLRLSTFVAGLETLVYQARNDPGILDKSWRLQHVALAIYRDLFIALRAEYRPEVSAVVFYGTDSLSHKYWRYFEPDAFSGTDPADVERYGSVIPDYYVAADAALGEILATGDENTTFLVVSDHGSQAIDGGEVLRMPRLAGGALLEAMGHADTLEATGLGNQTILTPRAGAADGSADMARVAAELLGARLADSEVEPFVVDLTDREGDAGDFVGVVFNLATERTGDDAFDVEVHFPGGGSAVLADLVASDFPVSGGHHLRGIVILDGPGVRAGGRIENANLPDVAPTVLYLLGLPVAEDMDGKPLVQAMDPTYQAAHPVRFVASHGGFDWQDEGTAEPMTDQLEQRLRALGYLTD